LLRAPERTLKCTCLPQPTRILSRDRTCGVPFTEEADMATNDDKNFFEQAGEAIGEGFEKTKEFVGDAFENIRGGAEDAKDTAADAVKDAKDITEKHADEVKHAARDAAREVRKGDA
jgi:hypothetical protein